MQDEHAAAGHAWIEEVERGLHRLVEVKVDVDESEGGCADLVGEGLGEEAGEIGGEFRMADGFADVADGGVGEVAFVGLVSADEVPLVETGEGVEEEEAAVGLGGEVSEKGGGVSLPDAELGEVAGDVLGLELAEVEQESEEARLVAVVVGLVAANPATVEIGEVGEGGQRVRVVGEIRRHEAAGPPGDGIEACVGADLAKKIAGVPRDGGEHGARALAQELLQTALRFRGRDICHPPIPIEAVVLMIAEGEGSEMDQAGSC